MKNKRLKGVKSGITRRLLTYVKPYRGYVAGAFVFSILYVACVLIGPVLYGWAIDAMIGKGAVDFAEVAKMTTGFIVSVVFSSLSQKFLNNCVNSLCYKLVRDLRREAFYSITSARVKYVDTHAQGDVMSRVVNDVDVISDGLLQGVAQLFTGVMTILATLAVMFVINYIIAIVVVVLTPVSMFVAAFIAKNTFKSYKRQVAVQGELTAHTKELLGGQKTVILFNEEKYSVQKFEEIDQRLYDVGWKAQSFSALVNPSTRFVNAVISAVVGVLGAIFCILTVGDSLVLGAFTLPAFSVGMLSAFISYANQYTKPFNEISNVVTQLQNAFASAGRVFEVIDEPGEDLAGEAALPVCRGDIRLENVGFSYSPEQKLIENLNLDVKAGSKIAVVGPTGCGKTTLINLLMRFYDLNAGNIYVDGVNAKDIPLDEYRKLFGMVLQESFLSGETVAYNISYGAENATREQIEQAAKAAYCDFFIRNLEEGYDTRLSDNVNVSQGEKQLLCIARIMLVNPPMLILDEATSNIDTMTEMRIQKAFQKIMKGKTSFIVAHRLSTILDADTILVMDHGSVIEQGTHAELLAKKGFYYHLYNSQFARGE
ncbi:ABC transporter ATP-binding protein [Candidatus Borkfalkia ceftriaxoniphila]|uniref:ABC transporter ATP-binding protein n=1 Tax=Candidatus Borkfalkia ceftriaxoniphila TaxID=2508949 RepID=A0A4Q2KEJ6_9FIRM|nr:ABC transporter ATP-binding protein [Candidatus Borkfalkia ceftriaxoniphila]RXZ62320.1 ABC transporter ATP-binding protein [Candidatus Borkfalkia ceftriaxoniphila]